MRVAESNFSSIRLPSEKSLKLILCPGKCSQTKSLVTLLRWGGVKNFDTQFNISSAFEAFHFSRSYLIFLVNFSDVLLNAFVIKIYTKIFNETFCALTYAFSPYYRRLFCVGTRARRKKFRDWFCRGFINNSISILDYCRNYFGKSSF